MAANNEGNRQQVVDNGNNAIDVDDEVRDEKVRAGENDFVDAGVNRPYRRSRAGWAVQMRKKRQAEEANARTAHFLHCLANPHEWRGRYYRPFPRRGRGRGGNEENRPNHAEDGHVRRDAPPRHEHQNL